MNGHRSGDHSEHGQEEAAEGEVDGHLVAQMEAS